MAEYGSRMPASSWTARRNIETMQEEEPEAYEMGLQGKLGPLSDRLRKELSDKGLKGFKRGGPVRRTGLAKLHAGEYVIPKAKVKKIKAVGRGGRGKGVPSVGGGLPKALMSLHMRFPKS